MFRPKVAFFQNPHSTPKLQKRLPSCQLSGCAIVIIVVILIIKERWVLTDGATVRPLHFTWGMPNLWAFGLLGVQVMENIGKPRRSFQSLGVSMEVRQ
jgi:hypothetical protein